MELDNIVVTKLFNILTIPIAQGRKIQMTDRYGYGLTFCATKGGRIHYYYQDGTYLSDYDHAVLLPKASARGTFRSSISIVSSLSTTRNLLSLNCQRRSIIFRPTNRSEIFLSMTAHFAMRGR